MGFFFQRRPADVDADADELRERMVRDQILARGISDPRVIAALRKVPRHLFAPGASLREAYGDHPLPIGHGQTISQPFIVAFMSQALELEPDDRVLEIGTGSGYQTAILAELALEVDSLEIVPELAARARERLAGFAPTRVRVHEGDGYHGLRERAPFDAILLAAAPERTPEPLLEQLAEGGRMIAPVGGADQELCLYTRSASGIEERPILPVRFVSMTGETRRPRGA